MIRLHENRIIWGYTGYPVDISDPVNIQYQAKNPVFFARFLTESARKHASAFHGGSSCSSMNFNGSHYQRA